MSGVKFMGKDPLGLAKGIRVDSEGNIGVQPIGSILAQALVVNTSLTIAQSMAVSLVVKPIATPYKAIIHFEKTYNGIDWSPLLASGQYNIDSPGWYMANLEGATAIRYVYDNQYASGFVVDVYNNLPTKQKSNSKLDLPSKRYAPSPPRVLPTLINTSGNRASDINPSIPGVVYGYGGVYIRKSKDYGVTWTALTRPWTTGTVRLFKRLSNGSLIVAVLDVDGTGLNKVYVSDVNELNFVEKITYAKGYADPWGGYSAYDNIVVLMPYVTQPRLSTDEIKMYLSFDFGVTFKEIFSAPTLDGWHNHDIAYDPYDDIIWMVSGDGSKHNNVYYTFDHGDKWYTLWDIGKCPYQFTNIACLPDAIVFGLDDVAKHGMYALPRLSTKSEYRTWSDLAKPAYLVRPTVDLAAAVPSTKPAVRYDIPDVPTMYMAARVETAELIATKNGRDYYTIWSLAADVDIAATTGLLSMFGPDDDGYLTGLYQVSGGVPMLWKAKAPLWIEI